MANHIPTTVSEVKFPGLVIKIPDFFDSIRKLLKDQRESQAVDWSKQKLLQYLMYVGTITNHNDRKKINMLFSLLIETHSATTKKDIKDILEKTRKLQGLYEGSLLVEPDEKEE